MRTRLVVQGDSKGCISSVQGTVGKHWHHLRLVEYAQSCKHGIQAKDLCLDLEKSPHCRCKRFCEHLV